MAEFPKQTTILAFLDHPDGLVISSRFSRKMPPHLFGNGAQCSKALLRIYFHNSTFLRGGLKRTKVNTEEKSEMSKR